MGRLPDRGGAPGNRPESSDRFRPGPGGAVAKLDRMEPDAYARGIAVPLENEKAEARDEAGRAVFTATETALHGR